MSRHTFFDSCTDCWQEVIDAYDKLFENDEGYDVIIYAGENENMEELHAHSIILRISYLKIYLLWKN
ncbi:unnamed protein product [Rhizophagus irregularis]|nr:unnamed protein product [Rhizophagus irregularis]CAB4437741.1 unnamed protein product [Rhizophagus irregularis]CAB4495716.1 unnamed protein product [Rhizophagus irregularis]CAB5175991.1 unnamed protein product [Rhizophagus irregularis]CAB5388695.1 unnamed protein product [Rhizophagus irregularis]